MGLDLQLRSATPADDALVYLIKSEAIRPYVEATWGWDEAEQRPLHARRFCPEETQILLLGEDPVGFFQVRRSPASIRLLSISVRPAWQSRGVGSHVLSMLQREARERGLPIELRVLRVNVRARALYERHGFRAIASTPTHHHMRFESDES